MSENYIPVQNVDKKLLNQSYKIEKRLVNMDRSGNWNQEKRDLLLDQLQSIEKQIESRIEQGFFIREWSVY